MMGRDLHLQPRRRWVAVEDGADDLVLAEGFPQDVFEPVGAGFGHVGGGRVQQRRAAVDRS